MKQFYAVTRWMIEDVQQLRPDWTRAQCRRWWEEHEADFADMLTEYGNEILCSLIPEPEEDGTT